MLEDSLGSDNWYLLHAVRDGIQNMALMRDFTSVEPENAAGASKQSEVQTAELQLDLQPSQPQTSAQAETPTLTFSTPSFRPQQRTPTLTGPAVLQPESPRLMPAPGAFPGSPMPASLPSGGPLSGALATSLPQAKTALAPALPGSPVHGVWNRSRDSLLQPQHAASAAADGVKIGLADVAAELIAETPQMQSRLDQQPARQSDHGQEDVFDHRSLLNSASESDAMLAVSPQYTCQWRSLQLHDWHCWL